MFRGDTRDCDIPIWAAEEILKYASEVEKVIIEENQKRKTKFKIRLILSIIPVICQLIMFGINPVNNNSIQLIQSINYWVEHFQIKHSIQLSEIMKLVKRNFILLFS